VIRTAAPEDHGQADVLWWGDGHITGARDGKQVVEVERGRRLTGVTWSRAVWIRPRWARAAWREPAARRGNLVAGVLYLESESGRGARGNWLEGVGATTAESGRARCNTPCF